MARRYDGQRARIYAAEAEAFEFSGSILASAPWRAGAIADPLVAFPCLNDRAIQRYVNKVFRAKAVREEYGVRITGPADGNPLVLGWNYVPTVVTTRPNGKWAWANYDDQEIRLPPHGYLRGKRIILHECAHHMAYQKFGSDNHDATFAEIYLFLVNKYMGKDAHQMLQDQFSLHNVRFRRGSQ